jgi:hypothetical protein
MASSFPCGSPKPIRRATSVRTIALNELVVFEASRHRGPWPAVVPPYRLAASRSSLGGGPVSRKANIETVKRNTTGASVVDPSLVQELVNARRRRVPLEALSTFGASTSRLIRMTSELRKSSKVDGPLWTPSSSYGALDTTRRINREDIEDRSCEIEQWIIQLLSAADDEIYS